MYTDWKVIWIEICLSSPLSRLYMWDCWQHISDWQPGGKDFITGWSTYDSVSQDLDARIFFLKKLLWGPGRSYIRHFWKRLWIITRALGQTNTGVNFKILTKMFYQNICLICSLLQHLYRPKWTAPSRNPNGLLHPEILYMNTSSLGIS